MDKNKKRLIREVGQFLQATESDSCASTNVQHRLSSKTRGMQKYKQASMQYGYRAAALHATLMSCVA
jgi:hypothetical protein